MDYLAKKDSTMSVWKQALETAKVYPSHKCNWSDAVEGMRSILTEVMKGGNAKELLDELNAKLLAGDVILDAPTAKTSRSSATGVVTVKWNKVSGATKYKVEYSTNKTTWKVLKSGTTSTSATHSGASIGTKYYYRVTALSANAVSEPSDVVSSTRKLAQPEIEVSNVASSGKIKVSWEKVDGAVEYEIYRADSKTGTYKLVKTTTSRSFTNTSATAGKTYYYKVKAIAEKSAGNSVDSEVKSRTCDLARPEDTLKNVASSGKIKVSWEKVDGAVEYEVYRATSKSGEYKLVKTTTGTSYTNTATTAGKTYYYKVKAIAEKSSADSACSEIKSRTCDLPRPDVSITRSSGKPKVSWNAVDGAVEYEVYRATSKSGTYSLIKTTTSLSYKDTEAVSGKTCYYKVVAVHSKSAANSASSSVVSIESR